MDDPLKLIPRGMVLDHPIVAVRAGGCYLWDHKGKRYLDFTSGVGALALGHGHPKVLEAIRNQLIAGYTHTCFCNIPTEPALRMMDRLVDLAPIPGPLKVLLCSSGAEAVENAVKIARACTGREEIVAFDGAFHGRTWMAMTLTAKPKVRKGFGPLALGVSHAPYGANPWAIAYKQTAAVIVEPIQGEGGVIIPPMQWLNALSNECYQAGALFIADEIQTGLGRTGHLFAVNAKGIQPDILVLSKALGGGLPLSAVIARAEVMDAVSPGGLSGGTYGGNPVACAAGLAVLDVVDNEDFLDRVRDMAAILQDRLVDMTDRRPDVKAVRGRGLLIGVEFETPERARSVLNACRESGLLLLHAGRSGEVVRFLPPLTIGEPEIEEACWIFEKALEGR